MIVHGPEPVIEVRNGPADAYVSFWITTYPGKGRVRRLGR